MSIESVIAVMGVLLVIGVVIAFAIDRAIANSHKPRETFVGARRCVDGQRYTYTKDGSGHYTAHYREGNGEVRETQMGGNVKDLRRRVEPTDDLGAFFAAIGGRKKDDNDD